MNVDENVERSDLNRDLSPANQALGIGALVGAMMLYLAVGEWPAEYYTLARWALFALSLILALWAGSNRRWNWATFSSVGAVLFNPVFPVLGNRSWDLFGAVYAVSYGLLGLRLIQPKVAAIFTGVFGISAAIAFSLTFYVNYQMPHGPKYRTGDIVCLNDGEGPCGEELAEDMSKLEIPGWAKFLRKNLILTYFFLVGGVFFAFQRSREKD